jgi:hypothetical protein
VPFDAIRLDFLLVFRLLPRSQVKCSRFNPVQLGAYPITSAPILGGTR